MVKRSDNLPGKEIPKDYREVATELVRNQGWRYEVPKSGYPKLFPPDRTKRIITVPKTPSVNQRSFENWLAEVRRAGGIWPPEGR